MATFSRWPLTIALLALSAWSVMGDIAPLPRPAKCDYSEGKWVTSESPPRYSGIPWATNYCKLLRSAFNCENNNRPDSLYRELIWQPAGCDLDYITADGWKNLVAGKKMLMIGDSVMSNAYNSLLCLVNSGGYRSEPFDDDSAPKGLKGVQFPSFDHSLHFYFSPFLTQAVKQRPDPATGKRGGYKVNITTIDPVVQFLVPYYDIVVFHTGVWWSQEQGAGSAAPGSPNQYYIQGVKMNNLSDVNAHWYAVKSWANFLTRWEYTGLPYFISYSPKHGPVSPTDPGEGSCGATRPMQWDEALDEYRDLSVAEAFGKSQMLALRNSTFRPIRVTRMSETRPDAHLGMWSQIQPNPEAAFKTPEKGDCTHWCLPGLPDSWMDMLYTHMLLEPTLLTPNR
eukprot:TRINITY_DN9767_c0_g1_i1.p1 TRINITY_DN9767_c0_g1~~TRINITY_DN9767_c0_g1_i1.p1  ORF type:complete len:396 (+),score=-5.08 TRINITY_DN9767_c0_g1_i1:198-1385(+)